MPARGRENDCGGAKSHPTVWPQSDLQITDFSEVSELRDFQELVCYALLGVQPERVNGVTDGHRDVLLAIDSIGHRLSIHRAAKWDIPELLTAHGVERKEIAVDARSEDEIAGRG